MSGAAERVEVLGCSIDRVDMQEAARRCDRFVRTRAHAQHMAINAAKIVAMHHDKALVITPTLFCEADYKADWEEPMRRIIDDWGLRYPGVKHVEHVYFYGAAIADPAQIEEYLREARRLGREFAMPAPVAAATASA